MDAVWDYSVGWNESHAHRPIFNIFPYLQLPEFIKHHFFSSSLAFLAGRSILESTLPLLLCSRHQNKRFFQTDGHTNVGLRCFSFYGFFKPGINKFGWFFIAKNITPTLWMYWHHISINGKIFQVEYLLWSQGRLREPGIPMGQVK